MSAKSEQYGARYEWQNILFCGAALWLTQVLASATSPVHALDAEIYYFLIKMQQVQGLTSLEAYKYRGVTVYIL